MNQPGRYIGQYKLIADIISSGECVSQYEATKYSIEMPSRVWGHLQPAFYYIFFSMWDHWQVYVYIVKCSNQYDFIYYLFFFFLIIPKRWYQSQLWNPVSVRLYLACFHRAVNRVGNLLDESYNLLLNRQRQKEKRKQDKQRERLNFILSVSVFLWWFMEIYCRLESVLQVTTRIQPGAAESWVQYGLNTGSVDLRQTQCVTFNSALLVLISTRKAVRGSHITLTCTHWWHKKRKPE